MTTGHVHQTSHIASPPNPWWANPPKGQGMCLTCCTGHCMRPIRTFDASNAKGSISPLLGSNEIATFETKIHPGLRLGTKTEHRTPKRRKKTRQAEKPRIPQLVFRSGSWHCFGDSCSSWPKDEDAEGRRPGPSLQNFLFTRGPSGNKT